MGREDAAQRAALLCAVVSCFFLTPVRGTTRLKSRQMRVVQTEAVVQQNALRSTIANASQAPVNFTLTTDIVLTAPLPRLELGSKVTITGKCKDKNGKPRRCVVSGGGRHTMFTGVYPCDIALDGLIIENAFGNVHVGPCSLSARYVIFRNNVGSKGAVLDVRDFNPMLEAPTLNQFYRCDFLNNTALFGDGGVVYAVEYPDQSPSLHFTECTFRNNRALSGLGGVIFSGDGEIVLHNVTFEGNSAASGGAIVSFTSSFTAINATFAANTATNGRGGALVFRGPWSPGMYKFCRSTFRGNVAKPSHYGLSSNIFFDTANDRLTINFCPLPVPANVLAPRVLSFKEDCTGCSGCNQDCSGNGKCVMDPIYAYPSCRCNTSYYEPLWCMQCRQGYTLQSQCTQCSPAYYHPTSKPATCAMCPGLSKVVPYEYMLNYIINTAAATVPQDCQKLCKKTQLARSNTGNLKKYCNMWIFMAQRMGAPAACAGKCFMIFQSDTCGVKPIQHISSYGITYQYLEPKSEGCNQ